MSNRTLNAFLGRGIDLHLANTLVQKKLTLSKLKQKQKADLIALGIDDDIADNILNEQRPPIPSKTVIKLLYESKRTCCICRDNSRSVIIHHIKEWHKSKDHSENNLVVLCLEHHNDAHTKKGLSLNLTEGQIKNSKTRWIDQVKTTDAYAILGLSTKDYSRWDYFNHNRIFELFLDKRLSNTEFRTTFTVQTKGLINDLGTFSIEDDDKSQFYSFGDGYMLYYYMKELFDSVLKTIPLIDITDKYNKEDIFALIKPGTFIAFQGGFYFKDLSNEHRGKNQTRHCYYKRDKIKLQFEFDAYETTSNSAWGSHLRGKKVVTPICFVKSITQESELLVISVSCLAIGSYFDDSDYRKTKILQLTKPKLH